MTSVSASPDIPAATPGRPHDDRSTAELVGDVTEQVKTLVRSEVALATAELKTKGTRLGVGAGMLGGAGVVALYGLGALIATVIIALALVMPAWLAALLVTVVLFAVAGVVALLGRGKLKAATPPVPEQAIDSTKQDIETVKASVRR